LAAILSSSSSFFTGTFFQINSFRCYCTRQTWRKQACNPKKLLRVKNKKVEKVEVEIEGEKKRKEQTKKLPS